jgi:hypothetical protein
MTQTDKEKLRMAKNLVKANNKKIKQALDLIDELVDDYGYDLDKLIISDKPNIIDGGRMIKDLEKIKSILDK